MGAKQPDSVWQDSQPVIVSLAIQTPFRIGAGRGGGENVELPILKAPRFDQSTDSWQPTVPASTFKGLLRHAIQRLIESLHLGDVALAGFRELFGDVPPPRKQLGAQTREGILQVRGSLDNRSVLSRTGTQARTSIRIDNRFGSVVPGALWDHEFVDVPGEIELRFILEFTYPIDASMAGLLLGGLRLLTNDTLGGFGSRGMGRLKDINIDPAAFEEYAQAGLEALLRGKP